MLFNSATFLFLFLPIAIIGFYGLRRFGWLQVAEVWLFLASLTFYSFWDVRYLPLLLGGIVCNYYLGITIGRHRTRWILVLGIAFNLGLLGFFKYADFFISNVNAISDSSFDLLHIVLPIGISFITFEQIAYLVDSYRGESRTDYGFVNYGNFVALFPQLIAGPIFHHREIIPQIQSLTAGRSVLASQIATGLFVLSLGLFKKVIIADNLAPMADPVFADVASASIFDAWVAALAYSFQLYFDFSGYSDMAIGLGLLFGIELPVNFNSPYKSLNIAEFWRRWHITLGRFLRDYVYIPLGGSRFGIPHTLYALLVTMFLGGLWHGAGWTFAIWGLLHGVYLVIYHVWSRHGVALPRLLAWLLTFVAVIFAWVLFRAESLSDAMVLWSAMAGLDDISLPNSLRGMLGFLGDGVVWNAPVHSSGIEIFVLIPMIYFVVSQPNVSELRERFVPNVRFELAAVALAGVAVANLGQETAFIYFQF